MERKNHFSIFDAILIFLIIFTPLFHGSIQALPLSIYQLTAFFLFTIFIIKICFKDKKFYCPKGVKFFIIFIVIILFQILPIPYLILKFISSNTAEIYQKYFIGFSSSKFFTMSIYPLETYLELIKLFSFFIIFIVVVNMVKSKKQFVLFFSVLTYWAAILCFYGLIRKYFILEKELSGAFSVFGNRNHFAGFMIIMAPIALGQALAYKDMLKRIIFSFLTVIIYLSIILSLSRGGILALLFSLVVMLFLVKKDRSFGGKYFLLIGLFILGLSLLLHSKMDPIMMRFSLVHKDMLGRLFIIKDSLGIVKKFPLFGVGLGNFQHIFPIFREYVKNSNYYYYYLHNDHLQLIVEAGLIGFFFYCLFIFSIFKDILLKFRERKDPFVVNMVAGGISGIVAVVIHSFVDFNFQITATAFIFWLVLGLTYKCAGSHFYK